MPSLGFNAQSQMGLAEVLQMCCLSRRSGQITFRSGESSGFVYIQHGRVLHALCGSVEGEEAVYRMLTWPGGGFTLNEDILPHKKTITLTWEQLLFEGARRADQGGSSLALATPVVTIEPTATNRSNESQPKLTIIRPDHPSQVHELTQEYTHLGRVQGNEIVLPYPSISSRHCIFILSGPDIVVRDLNSSNGTYVNGEPIAEVVLRPGDMIQVGVVEIKFEPGVKRPKLSLSSPSAQRSELPVEVKSPDLSILSRSTAKLPKARPLPEQEAPTDAAFVTGVSAISYENIAKPEEPAKKISWMPILIGIVVLAAIAAAVYFFVFDSAKH